MDREIVRIRTLNGGSVVRDIKYTDNIDYAKCLVDREFLENGLVIETFYLQKT